MIFPGHSTTSASPHQSGHAGGTALGRVVHGLGHAPRLVVVVCAITLGLLASLGSGAETADAFTHLYSPQGAVGRWQITDSSSSPGVQCRYGPRSGTPNRRLTRVLVHEPVAYAYDRTWGATDTQTVKWSAYLLRRSDGSVVTSRSQTKTATEYTPADFSYIVFNTEELPSGDYWVYTVIEWFTPNFTGPTGAVGGYIDYYDWDLISSGEFHEGVGYRRCPLLRTET
jgi:hypothetical protein